MKNKFYLFLIILLIIFTSCDDKIATTDENIPQKKSMVIDKNNIKKNTKEKLITTKHPKKNYRLYFKSLDNKLTTLEIKDDIYNFSNIIQPIVLVNFFSTWCPPCRGQIPHLNNLQKKYEKNLFVMGILVHDDFKSKKMANCISFKKIDYYISRSKRSNHLFAKILAPQLALRANFELPLMVMFVYGEYYTHYEGTVPEEMIESDIKQALKEI